MRAITKILFCIFVVANLTAAVTGSELLDALDRNDWKQVHDLIAAGADVNVASKDGVTPVMIVVERAGSPLRAKDKVELLDLLLKKGADPSASDRHGRTPLIIADRVGFSEGAKMLKIAGAKSFDPEDPKVKAVFIRIDASLLSSLSQQYYVENGAAKRDLTYPELRHWFGRSPDSMANITWKVLANRGIDVLGNAYLIRPQTKSGLQINPATVSALKEAVDKDYWGEYSGASN